jgi:hypothetical protein
MHALADTQRRLWRLVTAPEGVRAALAEAGDPAAAGLEGWLVSDARLPAALRLEIYANAYFGRIHGVMADDFGALAAAVGGAAFHDLVTAYLCVHPPERPSLRHVGERLADFLEDAAAAEPFRRRWPWAADLARLEIALADAFDAADAPPLAREDLAALPPERWAERVLSLHPAARLLELDPAAPALRRRFEDDETPEPPDGARPPVPVLVWRLRERVQFRAPEPEEAELLRAVGTSAAFGALCETLAARHGAEAAPARAAAWLATWIDAGLLAR